MMKRPKFVTSGKIPVKKMGQTDGLDPKREKLSILFRKT